MCLRSSFLGSCLREWLLSCLSQSTDRAQHTLDIWGLLKAKGSWAACCCFWGPMVQQTEANGKKGGACIRNSCFSKSCTRDWFPSWPTCSTHGTWDTLKPGGCWEGELGGLRQLQSTCSTIKGHQREQEIMSAWKKKPANPSSWESTCTSLEKTFLHKRFDRPLESLAGPTGKGLSLYKVSPKRLGEVVVFSDAWI